MENIETLLAAVAQTQGFDDDDDPPPDTNSSALGFQSSAVTPVEMAAPKITGISPEGDDWPSLEVYPLPLAAVPAIGSGGKRKRGRPAGEKLVAKPSLPKRKKIEDEEEDVCFICFDGGTLVLCDRKGCPKAYHPACIKRDEEFFNTDAKWNCGWHICSVCRKSSHYMCYMCTYSLCKRCTKGADYVCVRGNKGFCSTCMKTIMLFENKDQANNESVKVDFDDKLSWEYLFKVYWVILKEKLSLTLSELTHAKTPWKGGSAVACKPHSETVDGKVSMSSRTPELLELHKPCEAISFPQNDRSKQVAHMETKNRVKVENVSNYNREAETPSMENSNALPGIHTGANESCIDKATDRLCIKKDEDNPILIKNTNKPCICKKKDEPRDKDPEKPGILNRTEWISKELLGFVAHMKYGDTSALSQFDVQRLLLDYIKRNNLRDPHQKSQIVCDQRLTNLFGKARVGHIEMLKLLEFHFPITEDAQRNSFIPAGLVGSSVTDMDKDGNSNGSTMPVKGRKRICKKGEERAPQNNMNEYAAINCHNINLIYLRHNLMEKLIEDKGNFINKVVGSIVRIKISSNDQKPDVHRLVQVIGTSKVPEPYKIGDKTSDIMLEVLNLDKKEVVSIDSISNQEFSEDECRRLRQSIRCGLMKQFTVGELQNKVMALRPIKINNWLEGEILRLNHLRDRASEKGRKKELREYVNKLQLLKSPEERQRRISEVPKIHIDPKMSPDYQSDEDSRMVDSSRKDEYLRPIGSGFAQNERKPGSSFKNGKREASIQTHNRTIKKKIDANGSRCLEKHVNQVNVSNSADIDQAMKISGSETSTAAAPVGNSLRSENIETEKLWHYRDPNGKIQGPFAMMQLRKWSTTGLFPLDMRIWTNHEQYDSLLLTNALNGTFHTASKLPRNSPSKTEKHTVEGKNGSEGIIGIVEEIKQTEADSFNKAIDLPNRVMRADESGSCSSSPRCWDLLKDNNSSVVDVQEHIVLPSSDQNNNRGPENNDFNHVTQKGENKLSGPNQNKTISRPNQNEIISGHELQNQSDNQGQAVLSSEENITLPIDLMSSNEPVPIFSPAVDAIKQDGHIDLFDLHNPTPKTSDGHLEVLPAENQNSLSSDVPFQTSGILELPCPTPRSNSENQDQGIEVKQSGPIDLSVPIDSYVPIDLSEPVDLSVPIDLSMPIDLSVPNGDATWTSLVMGGEIPEVADEWCGYSPTGTKPAVQEWDLGNAASESSMRPPPEVTNENIATSSPNNNYNNEYTSWLAMLNEPSEFDVLGEESVSDLLAEVDAMESRGNGFASPTSAIKFAKELLLDCKDDCSSSIEEFSSSHNPVKSDSFSATESSVPANQTEIHAFDFFKTSIVNSFTSSEGETSAAASVSDFHHSVPNNTGQDMVGAGMGPGTGSEPTDPGWGSVQGNINLVTVQGNVNLILGGPGQGMSNLGWGTNPGTAWTNPNMNPSPRNMNCLPWENGQRNYSGERFGSPREWGAYQSGEAGFGRGRPPRGRLAYGGGGGYSRPPPKGQRVCKFYESGRCKKGAFCDYLHP